MEGAVEVVPRWCRNLAVTCPFLAAGCIPILLERHIAPGSVLSPIRFLGFEVVQLRNWQEVPEKLLQLGDQMARNPQVRNEQFFPTGACNHSLS